MDGQTPTIHPGLRVSVSYWRSKRVGQLCGGDQQQLTDGRWMEECIGEPIPPIVELEEALRDGVTLAKLARVFAPELVPRIFIDKKLQYRHSDNIDRFFRFLRKIELPEVPYRYPFGCIS